MSTTSLSAVEALGGFPVVYADPPWQYDNKGRGAAENHYPTMSLDDVKALPVSRLAAPDAVLFLWATWALLPEALEVMRAWDFEYKTVGFVWVKFTLTPDAVEKVKASLDASDTVMRYLIISTVKESTLFADKDAKRKPMPGATSAEANDKLDKSIAAQQATAAKTKWDERNGRLS